MTIEHIISDYSSYIYNFALKLSCHPTTAEDLTQQTFIKAWERLDTLENPDAIKSWLRQICYHFFLMEMRKTNPISLPEEELISLESDGQTMFSSCPDPEEEVIVEESIRDLQNGCFMAMVRRLTLHQRLAFSLVDMFGLSLSEAADIIGVSEKAVKGLLYRGRMNLDAFFHDHCQIINAKNPCSCQAWLDFSSKKSTLASNVRGIPVVDYLDYKEKHYTYDPHTRAKIHYLYQNMPEQKPSQSWYDRVTQLLQQGNPQNKIKKNVL